MVRAPAWPDGFALVAVSGRPSALTSSVAIGWLEMRTPMPPGSIYKLRRDIGARR